MAQQADDPPGAFAGLVGYATTVGGSAPKNAHAQSLTHPIAEEK
jgi:hypothetical protein